MLQHPLLVLVNVHPWYMKVTGYTWQPYSIQVQLRTSHIKQQLNVTIPSCGIFKLMSVERGGQQFVRVCCMSGSLRRSLHRHCRVIDERWLVCGNCLMTKLCTKKVFRLGVGPVTTCVWCQVTYIINGSGYEFKPCVSIQFVLSVHPSILGSLRSSNP